MLTIILCNSCKGHVNSLSVTHRWTWLSLAFHADEHHLCCTSHWIRCLGVSNYANRLLIQVREMNIWTSRTARSLQKDLILPLNEIVEASVLEEMKAWQYTTIHQVTWGWMGAATKNSLQACATVLHFICSCVHLSCLYYHHALTVAKINSCLSTAAKSVCSTSTGRQRSPLTF